MNHATRRFLLPAAAALSLAGLSACSRSEPEPAVTENAVADSAPPAPAEVPVTENARPAAEPTAEANAAAAELPPEAAAAPDEQMLDDASATGMTARAARGEEDAPTANVQE